MAKLGRSQPKSDAVVLRRLETAKIKSKSKWGWSVRKTNGIIPRLALCSRDIAKNTLCQKIILFIALTRKNNRKPFCRTFREHWLCNDTDFFSKSKNWKSNEKVKEKVELNSSVQNITLFIAVSSPKVYQKHSHQYLEKSTLSRGNWSSVLFCL